MVWGKIYSAGLLKAFLGFNQSHLLLFVGFWVLKQGWVLRRHDMLQSVTVAMSCKRCHHLQPLTHLFLKWLTCCPI